MKDAPDAVNVSKWEPPSCLIQPGRLGSVDSATVLLLPDKLDENGNALYADEHAGLVKTIKSQGGLLDFAWDSERRRYLSEYGAAEVVITITLGIIGNFTTDTIRWIVLTMKTQLAAALGIPVGATSSDDSEVRVKIARYEKSDGSVIDGITYKGPANAFPGVMQSLASRDYED